MSRRRTPAVPPAPVLPPFDGCTFDPEQHVYAIDGAPIVSVTQVLNEIGFVDFSKVPGGILSEAQARGSYVHKVLHYYLEGDFDLADVAEPYRGYVDSAIEYLAVAGMKPLRDAGGNPIAIEFRFWDRARRFAGQMDYLAWDPDGVLVVNDWKTGLPSDVAAPLQTAAYEYGLRKFLFNDHYPFPIRRRAVKLYREGKCGRPEPYDAEHGYDYQQDLGLFFSALSCVHYKRNGLRHAA